MHVFAAGLQQDVMSIKDASLNGVALLEVILKPSRDLLVLSDDPDCSRPVRRPVDFRDHRFTSGIEQDSYGVAILPEKTAGLDARIPEALIVIGRSK